MQDINEELVAQIGPISLEDILSEPTLDPLPSSHEPPRKHEDFVKRIRERQAAAGRGSPSANLVVKVSTHFNLLVDSTSYLKGVDAIFQSAVSREGRDDMDTEESSRVECQYALSQFYEDGSAFGQDERKAFIFLRESARAGNPVALCSLGAFYSSSLGCEIEYNMRQRHHNKPTTPDNDNLHLPIYLRCYNTLTGKQRKLLGRKVAVTLYIAAAEKGNIAAMHNMASRYLKGVEVPLDIDKALEYSSKAVDQGYIPSMCALGVMYEEGVGVDKNPQKAMQLYRYAAEHGDPVGLYNVGINYAHGLTVSQDDKIAAEYYARSAALGYATAQFNLGCMYLDGQGLAQSHRKACEWFSAAGVQTSTSALVNLAIAYGEGEGVALDEAQYVQLYRRAAFLGDEDANEWMEEHPYPQSYLSIPDL